MEDAVTPNIVKVELFGIARQRVGTDHVHLAGTTLGEVLALLGARYASFGRDCLETEPGGQLRLRNSFIANLDGQRFVSDTTTPLPDGCSLLILAADPGG